MTGGNDLRTIIVRIESIQAELKRATSRTDHERKLEVVNLRRTLAIELGRLGEAFRDSPFTADPAKAFEFRTRFSAMRSALALHQSQWPAVKLDQPTPEYFRSVESVRRTSGEFIEWAKIHLLNQ